MVGKQFSLLTYSWMALTLFVGACSPPGSPSDPSPPSENGAAVSTPSDSSSEAKAEPVSPEVSQTLQKYDWTTDRILGRENAFQTQAYFDAVKPNLDYAAFEHESKSVETSGGYANIFARDLPGSGNIDHVPNTPAVVNDKAFFLTASETSSNFYALRENGQVAWELALHDNNGRFVGSSPAVGNAAGSATLYALSSEGRIYAVDADRGIVKSFVDLAGDTFENTSPFVIPGATDSVYVASRQGQVFKYTFNGSNFSLTYVVEPVDSSVTGRFGASPIVSRLGGNIYIGSEEGRFYKLRESDGAEVSVLNLDETVRAEGCQVQGDAVLDAGQDIAIVPCGAYLYKIRLNDASTSDNMALVAQSPLLEVEKLLSLEVTRVTGPAINNRPLSSTYVSRAVEPNETEIALENKFGFQNGDYIRVESETNGNLFAKVVEIDEANVATLEGMTPLPSPLPSPLLFGGEKVSVANSVVRPYTVPTPTPTATPVGADPVTQFTVGNLEGFSEGDSIVFPTLPGQPVASICSSTHPDCSKSSTENHAGIEVVGGLYQLTLPGSAIQEMINAVMADTRYVPIEKLSNRVMGSTNTTDAFDLGSVSGFSSGDFIRIKHGNGNLEGRYEYAYITGIDSIRNRLTLDHPLRNAPQAGDLVEIVKPNSGAYGRVSGSSRYSSGNILSSPVLSGNGQHVYLQHGNLLFELDYSNDTSFSSSATYLVLQSGRLDQSNLGLTALSRSAPLISSNDKLYTVDNDPSGKVGIFMNRVFLPLSATSERLNDSFPISSPNAIGNLSNRAETRPAFFNSSGDHFIFGGGNGTVYKLHKDMAW